MSDKNTDDRADNSEVYQNNTNSRWMKGVGSVCKHVKNVTRPSSHCVYNGESTKEKGL